MKIKCIIERIGGISGKRLFIRRFKDVEWSKGDAYMSMDRITSIFGCVRLTHVSDKVDVLNLVDDNLLDIAMEILETEEMIHSLFIRKLFSSFAVLNFEGGKVQEIQRYMFDFRVGGIAKGDAPTIRLCEYSEGINTSDPNIKLIENIELSE